MSAIATAIVGSAVVGAYAASSSADAQAQAAQGAADTSAGAARYSADIQKQMYDQTRTDQTPWRDAGANALGNLSAGMGSNGTNGALTRNFTMADYQADPGYQFRMSEGVKALDRSAAARGGLLSGSQLKGITRYGQDAASQEYGNAYNRYQSNQTNQYNRLASLAGVGQTANNALQQAGSNYANAVGDLSMTNAANSGNAMMSAANSRASSYQGMGNAVGSTLSNPNVQNGISTWWNGATSSAGDPYMGSSNAVYLN